MLFCPGKVGLEDWNPDQALLARVLNIDGLASRDSRSLCWLLKRLLNQTSDGFTLRSASVR